jgi:hypothetical protein
MNVACRFSRLPKQTAPIGQQMVFELDVSGSERCGGLGDRSNCPIGSMAVATVGPTYGFSQQPATASATLSASPVTHSLSSGGGHRATPARPA